MLSELVGVTLSTRNPISRFEKWGLYQPLLHFLSLLMVCQQPVSLSSTPDGRYPYEIRSEFLTHSNEIASFCQIKNVS
jgi:hypothetical protein